MAYTKQTWQDLPSKTTPINASRLTHIEDGIFNAASTADSAASTAASAVSGLADKVDKVEGKGLSTNDFTDTLKTKLDGIATGAEVNVQSDWNQTNNTNDDFIKNKPTLGTASSKNSTSVVTNSTDLVESGAVENIIGWGNKNYLKLVNSTNHGLTFTSNDGVLSISGTSDSSSSNYIIYFDLPDGDYIFYTGYIPSSSATSFTIFKVNQGSATSEIVVISSSSENNYIPFTVDHDGYDSLQFRIWNRKETAFNYTCYPMVCKAEAFNGMFEPYHESVEQTLRDAEVVQGKNLLPNNATTQTVNGVTFTVNADGSVTANGTATANATFVINSFNRVDSIFNSDLILSGCPSGGSASTYELALNYKDSESASNYQYIHEFGNGVTISLAGKWIAGVYIMVRSGVTVSNKVFYPMISADGGAYEPYYIPLKDVVPTKADNSVIAPVENGATASQAYAVNDVFIRNNTLCKVTSAISQGDTLSNQFTVTNVGAILTALLNA